MSEATLYEDETRKKLAEETKKMCREFWQE